MSDDKKLAGDDLLDLGDFAESLKNYCLASKDFPDIEGSFNISLNADFGCGKSFFLERFAQKLKNDGYDVISIDSWRNDFYDEPIVTILAEIVLYLEGKYPDDKEKKQKIHLQFNEILEIAVKFAFKSANRFIQSNTGVDVSSLTEKIEQNAIDKINSTQDDNNDGDNTNLSGDIFAHYIQKKQLFDQLSALLTEHIEKIEQKPLFIFIDELDRCRPTHAINFLEVLKHFFDVKNIIFIIAANRGQLESSAQKLFGSTLNFDEYYRKFIHKEINLPAPSDSLINDYFKISYIKNSNNNDRLGDGRIDSLIAPFLNDNRLTLRQINDLVRDVIAMIPDEFKDDEQSCADYLHIAILYIMIKSTDKKLAEQIKSKEDSRELFNGLRKAKIDFHNVEKILRLACSFNFEHAELDHWNIDKSNLSTWIHGCYNKNVRPIDSVIKDLENVSPLIYPNIRIIHSTE